MRVLNNIFCLFVVRLQLKSVHFSLQSALYAKTARKEGVIRLEIGTIKMNIEFVLFFSILYHYNQHFLELRQLKAYVNDFIIKEYEGRHVSRIGWMVYLP